MSTTANPTPQHPEDDAHYRAVLNELVDIGMAIARDLPARAKSPLDPIADVAAGFERLSRGIRRTIYLAKHIDDPVPAACTPAACAPAACDIQAAQTRAAARRQIIREVEDAIHRQDPADQRNLRAELQERLDSPDLDDELIRRPLPDIIANIVRDFGLAATPGPKPWKRRTPADIAALCEAAARQARPQADPAITDPEDEPKRRLRLIPGAEPDTPIAAAVHPAPETTK